MPTSDLQKALDRFTDKMQHYLDAEQYYEGTRPEVFSSNKMRRALAQSNTQFRVNFACTPVDVVNDRLEITSIQVIDDPTSTKVVEQLWTDNGLDLEIGDINRQTLMFGESFWMVWESVDSTEDAPAIDMCWNSPLIAQVFYDTENPKKKLFAAKRWIDDGSVRVNLYYGDRIEKYIAEAKAKAVKEQDFSHYTDEDNDDPSEPGGTRWPLPNPTGKIPFFHRRTSTRARPEHRNAYGPQDMISKLVANQMGASDFAGWPQRYMLSDANTDSGLSEFDRNDLINDLDPSNPPAREVDTPVLTAAPGEVWDLKGIKAVGQFATADPKNFLDPIAAYIRAMASTCGIPIWFFEGMADPPSGIGLRTAEAPLNKKAKVRQGSFGRADEEALEFGLELMGIPNAKVQVNWQNPASYDDTEWWAVAIQKVALGVPLEQVLIEAGYDPSDAKTWAAAIGDLQAQQARAAAASLSKKNSDVLATGALSVKGDTAPVHPGIPQPTAALPAGGQ